MSLQLHRLILVAAPLRASLLATCRSLAIVMVAGCAQHILPSAVPGGAAQVQRIPQGHRIPAPCNGQMTYQQYATVEDMLQTTGGEACIPAFSKFGGKVAYPNLSPSISVVVITSTTNYDNMPSLGSGTPILYIQLATSGGTSFGTQIPSGGGLLGSKIVPAETYTAFGQAVVDGIKVDLGPCYAVAAKSIYGGKLNGIGTLLKGQNIPVRANGVVEIYPGKQAVNQC